MRYVLIACFVFFQLSIHAQRLSEQAGDVKKVTSINGGFSLQLSNAYIQLLSYNANTVRVRASKTPFAKDESYAIDDLNAKGIFTKKESGNIITFSTDSVKAVVTKSPFRIAFYNTKGDAVNSDDSALGISWWGNQVSCYKQLHKDEKFIGLGEKTGPINRRGNYYYHWNSDVPAYGINADPLYSTIPFFIGITGNNIYGIFFDNTHKSYFNFGGGADEEIFHFGADDGEMNYYYFSGSSVPEIIKNYTALTGRTPMPPMWSIGYQQSRWGYDSQEQIVELAKSFRDKKLPADVIVSDIPYMQDYKIFTWNKKGFPNPKAMMDKLKQLNFDVVTIIDPGIKTEANYKAYDEGLARKYFVTYPNGKPYAGHVWPGRCYFPDFTKTAVREWWGNNFKPDYVDNGIRGFWNDMNEPAAWGREFPNLVEFGDAGNKKTLYSVKNAYGLLMSKSTYEGTRKLMNGQRPFVLTRAAYAGIQKYSAQWTGDNVASDEHMLLGFRLLNSMGVSGVPYVGMDIGGFIGNPSPELFMRWFNLGIYSPLFRNHSTIDQNYREPWLFGEKYTRDVRNMLEERYQLLPYLYSSFYQAHQTGLPINRMLPVVAPFDEKVYSEKYQNQFMHGDNLLVCPVESNKSALEVYLPDSTSQWYRYTTGEIYTGGKAYYVPAPLNDVPVFVKASGIVVKQSVVQSTKEKGDGVLYIHVWQGNTANTFTLYEDDGDTYDYESGKFITREITYKPAENKLVIGEAKGNYTSKYNKVKVILHTVGSKVQEYTQPLTLANAEVKL